MQSTGAKLALAVGAVAVMVVLFVVLQGGDDSDDTATTTAVTTTTTTTSTADGDSGKAAKPETPTISIDGNGEPISGVERLSVAKDDQVRFNVKSKIDDSVHVHVYDVEKEVPAGKTVKLSFPATIEGVFEIESHTTGTQLGELRVNP